MYHVAFIWRFFLYILGQEHWRSYLFFSIAFIWRYVHILKPHAADTWRALYQYKEQSQRLIPTFGDRKLCHVIFFF